MAEASMEDRPTINRFFCHKCNIHFQNATSNFTCPHCSHGFIEELDDVADNQAEFVDDLTSSDDEVLQMMHLSELERLFSSGLGRATHRSRLRRHASSSSGASSGSGAATANSHSNRRRRWPANSRGQSNQGQSQSHQQQGTTTYGGSPFENLIQEFIVNLGGVGWTADFTTGQHQPHHHHHHHNAMHLLLPGNPGDYAWGREGLDAIVTQLLNQMDSSGPPPLQSDAIQALPLVGVTEEQVQAKLQCSVCWEDFKFDEQVKMLPCQHMYHDGCIVPWLTLHGTCPICRKVLQVGTGGTGEDGTEVQSISESHETNSANGNSTFNTLQQLFNAVHGSTSSSNNDVSSASTNTYPSSQQQNEDSND